MRFMVVLLVWSDALGRMRFWDRWNFEAAMSPSDEWHLGNRLSGRNVFNVEQSVTGFVAAS